MNGVESLSATKLALLGRKLWAQDGDLRKAEPIAIVGIGCRFPGGADTPERLWDLLAGGRDAVTEVPEDRWSATGWFDEDPAIPGRMNSRWGGFLDDVRGFDAAYFDISPREAERMDPQQRLALEVSCEAIERAGIPFERLRGAPVGVFFASYHNDYALLQYADPEAITARTLTGSLHALVANRISYLLGLRGPSFAIDSACSSSLVATHLACQSLRSRDCDVALAGGVSVMAAPHVTIALSKGGFMSPTGRCHTFDAAADGFVRAEGCGVVVLKRLADAIAAGDTVLGVIRGSAVNQDGESTTLSAPNGLAQEELLRSALRNAGLRPEQVSLIEAHGTGTELGDPIETDALIAAFRGREKSADPCWLGSIKSNVGHLEAAAGVAGLIKVLLCMRQQTVPPHALFHSLNRHIELPEGTFRVATEPTAWTPTGPRIAGVSAFGVGGTNAHVLVEEPPAGLAAAPRATDAPNLLTISAKDEAALRQLAGEYAHRLGDGMDAGALCVAAARRRSHHRPWRAAIVAADGDGLAQQLDAIASGERPLAPAPAASPTCFVFTGQGSQYPGMAASLRAREPAFAAAFEQAAAAILAAGGPDVTAETERSGAESQLHRTDVAQAAIFTTQYALVRLLDGWGIRPGAVIGHSIGELAAAMAAGILDLPTAAAAVVQRGRLMEQAFDLGRMASVRASEELVSAAIARHQLAVTVAAVNGPTAVVVSGSQEAVEHALATLAAEGLESTRLDVRFPFHGAEMAASAGALEQALRDLRGSASRISFFSTVTGSRLETLDGAYLARNVRSPVRFAAAVESALSAGFRHFVEIGSHPALGRGIIELGERRGLSATTSYCLHRERDDRLTLRTLVAQAYEQGVTIDWDVVFPGAVPSVELPTYPWQHKPYWLPNPPDLSRPGIARPTASQGFPGIRLSSPALTATVFELALSDPAFGAFADHRVGGEARLPATAMVELIRRAAVEAAVRDAEVAGLGILRPLPLRGEGRLQTVLNQDASGRWNAELFFGDEDSWELIASGEVGEGGRDLDPLYGSRAKVAGEALPREAFYIALATQGCDFGDRFRLLDDITVGPDEATGSVLADAIYHRAGTVDPACTDAAAQLCVAVLRARGLASGEDAFLPWSLDRYRVVAAGMPRHARVQLRDASADAATFDVELADGEGRPIARLEGWRVRRTSTRPSALRQVAWTAEAALPPVPVSGPRGWLLVGTEGTLPELGAVLEAAGREVEFVGPEKAEELAGRLQPEGASAVEGIIVAALPGTIGGADAAARVVQLLLPIARSLASGSAGAPRLLVVTRGTQEAGVVHHGGVPGGAAGWGIVRALRAENPALRCTCLDLDAADAAALDPAGEVAAIAEEALSASADPEVAVRDGVRLVARPALDASATVAAGATGPVALVHRTAGTLDGFALEPAFPARPGAGELLIRVLAAGMNFRDVLTALGSYPGAHEMGHECCGVVEAVGEGVSRFAPGDRVMTFSAGTFRNFVLVPERFAFPAPRGFYPVAVAGIPVAFGTAHYALRELGRIGRGDSVLIHSAAGGVGLASVQLALAAGARVFVTAGSPQKREMLLRLGAAGAFDSRSDAFADELLSATGGEGVALVLNSLIGAMIPAGMRVLRSGGLFVELGKREKLTPEQAAAYRSDVRYVAFDLGDEGRADPALLPRLFAELGEMLSEGSIAPLPTAVFPMSEASAAFRRMARAEHVGKLVLVPPPLPARALEGWVVVTGGTGGVGSTTVRWLLSRGARRVAVWGRSTPSPSAAAAFPEAVETEIRHMRVDVTDRDAVEAALATLRADAPVSGVIHSAAVVDDATLVHQDEAHMAAVLGPKLNGAWNLHEATLGDPIELFVLYSAAGPLIDASGQANYAAANAAVDELGLHRRRQGFPAVSVQWGPWSGAGMAARLDESQRERWTRRGLEWWDEAAARPVLDALLRETPSNVLALRLRERRAGDAARTTATAPRAGGVIRAELEALPPALREQVLRERIQAVLVNVLGTATPPGVDAPLRDAGVDSLSAIELRNALGVACGTSLPATLAFDHPTVSAIASYLLRELKLAAEPTEGEGLVIESTEDVIRNQVEQLSDEEAEMLLLQELGLGPSTEIR